MLAKTVALLIAFGSTAAGGAPPVPIPTSTPSLEADVRSADAAFWQAFNTCDRASMGKYLTEDVEFYHDTTGLTRTRAEVLSSLVNGPCGTPDLRMRRELVEAGAQVQPVPGYGAMWSGTHIFLAREGKGAERPATQARFMVIWRPVAGQWQMARVISYDHTPIPYSPPSSSVRLPADKLAGYVGRYHTAPAGDIDISLQDGSLILQSGGLHLHLAASAPDHFFALERDLQFIFSPSGTAMKIEVLEAGTIVANGARTP